MGVCLQNRSCSKPVGIYAEGKVFTQLLHVCYVCVKQRGKRCLFRWDVGFRALPFIVATCMHAWVKNVDSWPRNVGLNWGWVNADVGAGF